MELTVNNGLLTLVDAAVFDFGEVGEKDIKSYAFEFKGSEDQIEYLEKGCGCSSAFYKDGKIQGELDIAQANGNQPYNEGESAINPKYIFVYLNDGEPRFIADSLKQKQANPAKTFFKLSLIGKVVK